MDLVLTIFSDTNAFFDWPGGIIGWVVLLLILILVIYFSSILRFIRARSNFSWLLFAILLILQILASVFIGIRLPLEQGLAPPGSPSIPTVPLLMIFSAIPWVFAAGFMGVIPSVVLAFLSGIILGLFQTHNPFTIFEIVIIGLLFGWAMNQRYRTWPYKLLRRPIVPILLFTGLYPIIFIISQVLNTPGELPAVLDYALSNVISRSVIMGSMLIFAGVMAEVIAISVPELWGNQTPLKPSPAETSLSTRSLYLFGPAIIIFMLALTIFGWIISGNAARLLIQDRMESTALLAADIVPYALEVGQNSILKIAETGELSTLSPDQLDTSLRRLLFETGYFQELIVVGTDQTILKSVPGASTVQNILEPEELVGIELANQGVPFQYYVIQQIPNGNSARLTFIARLNPPNAGSGRVLIGRTDLTSNPFILPILNSLKSLENIGEGMLLSEKGQILYHTNNNRIMDQFPIELYNKGFFEFTAPDGTRSIGYLNPALGRAWNIVVTVSAKQVQSLALTIAAPLMVLLLLLSIFVLIFLRIILGIVTRSLRELAVDANRIARDQKQLANPLVVQGVDEVGQLRRAFEKMRVSLKDRLDEQEQFLLVSQGVAASMEMGEAVKPVLEAALTTGASMVCVILSENALAEFDDASPTRFSLGSSQDKYTWLDRQILELVSSQSQIILTNPARARLFSFESEFDMPEALMALALRHENFFYGVMWVGYDTPHKFSDEEIRFLTTISGQAALAAANSRLFSTAQIGRQRLEAILAATPDPVLVTDFQNRLLLANPKALQIFGEKLANGQGSPISEVISNKPLVELMTSEVDGYHNKEIMLEDNQVYFTTVSAVSADEKQLGLVCVLRNITHFKQLDSLKTEFVNTVSHDLRSPLTLIHGYATMLNMVGELNEQQLGYIRKITTGVENMSQIVNDLLDLGRIEAGVGLLLKNVSVMDLLEKVSDSVRLQAIQKKIEYKTEFLSDNFPLIEADLALIERTLHNLIDNAIKYTKAGGEVIVSAQLSNNDQCVLFQIKDNGIGIAPVDQLRLFDKFFRVADREARKQRGTGLGLAIVKSIAERHNGRVWVESHLGKGSRFFFELPIRQP